MVGVYMFHDLIGIYIGQEVLKNTNLENLEMLVVYIKSKSMYILHLWSGKLMH